MIGFIDTLIQFMEDHQHWALLVVFFITFIDCFFLLGFFMPAATILVAVGALVGASDINLLWIIGAATLGSILATSISYQIGRKMRPNLRKRRIYRQYRRLFLQSKKLLARYGVKVAFWGRFFSPLRAILPTAAGAFHVNHFKFEVANILSSLIWPQIFLLLGYSITH